MLTSSLWGQNYTVGDQAPAEPLQRLLRAVVPPPSPSLFSHCFIWWRRLENLSEIFLQET